MAWEVVVRRRHIPRVTVPWWFVPALGVTVAMGASLGGPAIFAREPMSSFFMIVCAAAPFSTPGGLANTAAATSGTPLRWREVMLAAGG